MEKSYFLPILRIPVTLSLYPCCYFQTRYPGNYVWGGNLPLGFHNWDIPQSPYLDFVKEVSISTLEGHKYTESPLKDLISTYHPRQEGPMCAAFVIYSSLELKWVTLPCDLSLRDTLAICQTPDRTPQHNSTPITREHFECPNGWVKINSYCHQMISRPGQHLSCEEARAVCKGMFSFSDGGVDIIGETLMYMYYFEWLNDPQEGFFYGGDINHCFVVQVAQSLTLVSVAKQNGSMKTPPSATVCKAELIPTEYLCSHSQFTCGDGSSILQHYLCDGKIDCPDHSDETDCNHVCLFSKEVKMSEKTSNCYTDCHPSNCSCHALYYQCREGGGCIPASKLCDGKADCTAEEDELECFDSDDDTSTPSENAERFNCSDGTQISIGQVNDLIPDCPGGNAEDETNMKLYWSGNGKKLLDTIGCPTTYTQCIKGLPGVCYPRHKICTYEVDSEMQIKFCRNGAHLGNCSNHECPSMFKCPLSYCIPYHYVCNDRPDCPHGEDEAGCQAELKCRGLLRCRHDGVCVQPENVGNTIIDCQLSKDDETFIDVRMCPASCKCLGHSVLCSSVDFAILDKLWGSIKKLSVLTSVVDMKFCLRIPKLRYLNFMSNEITSASFPLFCSVPHIVSLNLHNNSIQVLRKTMFRGLHTLRYLELQMNPIHKIDQFSFADLQKLQLLNLSYLSLKHITVNSFAGLFSLVTLDLSYNGLVTLDTKSFSAFKDTLITLLLITNSTPASFLDIALSLSTVANIHVYSERLCPYIGDKATCHFVKAYKGRCCTLIPNLSLEITLWLYDIALMTMSLGSTIVWTVCKSNNITKLFMAVINMFTSGVSMYPLYIVALHQYYGSQFLFYREYFPTTFHCNAVSLILLWCHYNCIFVVLLRTCHHCALVVFPLNDHSSMEKWISRALPLFLILAIACTAVLQIIPGPHAMTNDPNCQILLKTNNSTDFWLYVYLFQITGKFLMHTATAIIHLLTSYKLKKPGSSLTAHGGSRLKEPLSERLSLPVLRSSL